MLSEDDIGQALVKICLEDTTFDVIIIHETDYMKRAAIERVIDNALDQSTEEEYTTLCRYGVPVEEHKKSHSNYLQRRQFGIVVPHITDIDHFVLLDAYTRYVSVHFHPSQMNVFLLTHVKYNTHDDLTTIKVEVSYLFRHVADFQLDPVNVVRRLYQSDCSDTPIQEYINKR